MTPWVSVGFSKSTRIERESWGPSDQEDLLSRGSNPEGLL